MTRKKFSSFFYVYFMLIVLILFTHILFFILRKLSLIASTLWSCSEKKKYVQLKKFMYLFFPFLFNVFENVNLCKLYMSCFIFYLRRPFKSKKKKRKTKPNAEKKYYICVLKIYFVLSVSTNIWLPFLLVLFSFFWGKEN